MKNPVLVILFGAILFWSLTSFSALNCRAPEAQYFESNEPLNWSIQGNFDQVNDNAIQLHEKDKAVSDGILSVGISNSGIPVKISARGAFRYEECPLRPFNLELLDKNQKGEFPFLKHFSKLKLLTVCYDQQEHREDEARKLLKEYTVYKMTNHFKGPHVQVRLVNTKLLSMDGKVYYQGPGFLRESDSALGSRCGLVERGPTIKRRDEEKQKTVRWLLLKDRTIKPYLYFSDKEAELRMEFINGFLGNIDFHIEFDHNVIPLISKDPNDLREFLIPYDFDLAHAAGGTYYGFTSTPTQVALKIKNWLFNVQQIAPEFSVQMANEFLEAIPGMKKEISASPLDAKGKSDLMYWVNAFETVFKN